MKYHQTKIIGVVLFPACVVLTCKKTSAGSPKDPGKPGVITKAHNGNAYTNTAHTNTASTITEALLFPYPVLKQ